MVLSRPLAFLAAAAVAAAPRERMIDSVLRMALAPAWLEWC
jgi:hypothetical protein